MSRKKLKNIKFHFILAKNLNYCQTYFLKAIGIAITNALPEKSLINLILFNSGLTILVVKFTIS